MGMIASILNANENSVFPMAFLADILYARRTPVSHMSMNFSLPLVSSLNS